MHYIVVVREGEYDTKTGGLVTPHDRTQRLGRQLRLMFRRALSVRVLSGTNLLVFETAQVIAREFHCEPQPEHALQSRGSLLSCPAAYDAIRRHRDTDIVVAVVDTTYAMLLPHYIGLQLHCIDLSKIGLQRNAAWKFDIAAQRMDLLHPAE